MSPLLAFGPRPVGRSLFGSLFLVLVWSTAADAGWCFDGANPEITLDAPDGETYYMDNDLCQPLCLASAWIYEESNGIWGLQRNDTQVDCSDWPIPSDTIVDKVFL